MKKFLVLGLIFLVGLMLVEARGDTAKAMQLNLIPCANDEITLVFMDNVEFSDSSVLSEVPVFSIRDKAKKTIIQGICKPLFETRKYFITLRPEDLRKLKEAEYTLILRVFRPGITSVIPPLVDTREHMFGGDNRWTIPIIVKYTNQNSSSYSIIK